MDDELGKPESGRNRRFGGAGSHRTRILAGGLGLVLVTGLGGWLAGTRIASPAEIAARAEPPAASLITVAVERRVLSADIVTRGEVGYADPVSLSLGGATGDPGARQIVTSLPDKGAQLVEGSVALGVGGRPVLLLQGTLPSYRDLRPGSTGADVAQLEAALVRLGHLASADDRWTAETGAALAGLYKTVGYLPSPTGQENEDALTAAKEQVRAAERVLRELDSDPAGVPTLPSELLTATTAVDSARDAVVFAQAERAQGDASAKAAAESARVGVDAAAQAVASAQAQYERAKTAVDPITGEPLTALDLAPYDDTRTQTATALNEARSALTVAEAAVGPTAIGGENAEAVAHRDLAVAKAALVEIERPVGNPATARQRAGADAELACANAELAALVESSGTWLPAGEVVYLLRFPVQVATREVTLGQVLAGPYMTVAGATTTMKVTMSAGDASRVAVGDEVLVDEPGLPAPLSGAVSTIPDGSGAAVTDAAATDGAATDAAATDGAATDGAATDGAATDGAVPDVTATDAAATDAATTDGAATDAAAGSSRRVTITVDLPGVPDNLIGTNVRVVIPVDSTDGEVLVVPAAALSAVADGDVRVQVEDPDADGGARFVTVTTGLASGGDVEVLPTGGDLAEGDRVVVGLAGRSTPSGTSSGDDAEPTSAATTTPATQPSPGASNAD